MPSGSYKAIVTHGRVYRAIGSDWIITLLLNFIGLIYEITAGAEYEKSFRFGSCFPKQSSFLLNLVAIIMSIILSFFITTALDIGVFERSKGGLCPS